MRDTGKFLIFVGIAVLVYKYYQKKRLQQANTTTFEGDTNNVLLLSDRKAAIERGNASLAQADADKSFIADYISRLSRPSSPPLV